MRTRTSIAQRILRSVAATVVLAALIAAVVSGCGGNSKPSGHGSSGSGSGSGMSTTKSSGGGGGGGSWG